MNAPRYLGQGPYTFTTEAMWQIREHPGIFVLYNENACILTGSAKNLRHRLRELLQQPCDCMKQNPPTHFQVAPCAVRELEKNLVNLRQKLDIMGRRPLCDPEF